MDRSKVTIVGGGGGVGSSVAYNLLLRPEPYEVVVADHRPEMVVSHVMDLEQVVAIDGGSTIRGGELADAADSAVVVVCASAPLKLNTTRMAYLDDNIAIVERVVDALGDAWDGTLVMVTNPVDVLCTAIARRRGGDRRRMLGYTLNDSLRLRTGIAAELAVDAAAVEAWMLGEHGDASVPIFSRVAIDGHPVTLEPAVADAALAFVRGYYTRHVALDSGRSSTWTSGLGLSRMVAAILHPRGEVTTASVLLEGEYGIDGVSLGVPVTLGAGGVEEVHEWSLSPAEQEGMAHAAALVGEAADRLEAPARS